MAVWFEVNASPRSTSFSQSVTADRPLVRRPWSQDTSSASTVLCMTAQRENVCGPRRTSNVHEVDRGSLRFPAKSASVKRPRFSSAGSSPKNPTSLQFLVVLTCLTIRQGFLSQSESHFVIFALTAPTARADPSVQTEPDT